MVRSPMLTSSQRSPDNAHVYLKRNASYVLERNNFSAS